MANKFVRKSGSDANAGTSAGAAWLTLGKALGASGISSGDTLYIGAGVYREVVTVAMTSAVAETQIIADVDGAQTGDAGSVTWTSFLTDDKTANSTSVLLNLNGRDHLTFQGLYLVGGNVASNASLVNGDTAESTDIRFFQCVAVAAGPSSRMFTWTGTTGGAANWSFDSCVLMTMSGLTQCFFQPATVAGADYDIGITFTNCLLIGSNARFIYTAPSGASAGKPGGLKVTNCTAIGQGSSVVETGANHSTSIPCTVNNCVFFAQLPVVAQASGQLSEDWNILYGATPRTNVTAGGNSKTTSYAPLWELGYGWLNGFLPQPFFTPTSGSPLLGFGAAASPPSVDALQRPRPAGGSSTNNALGAFERHDTGAREASVVDASTYSLKLTGPADHALFIPVNAAATVITLRARYDTNHGTGSKPQAILQAAGDIGVSTETKTMTAGIDTWETLTFSTFTPTAKGFVTVRLVSRAAAGNGIAYFDTITASAIGTGNEDYWRRGEAFPAATTSSSGGKWSFP